MHLLAISTSTSRWTVWLHRQDGWERGVVAESGRGAGQRASLTRMVWDLLREASLTPGELQRVVCDVGPGSFTGLRQGLAVARALAWAHGIPGQGVGSLQAMAMAMHRHAAPGQSFAVALPARADVDFVGMQQSGSWSERALAVADTISWWQHARPDWLGIPASDRNRTLAQWAATHEIPWVEVYPEAEWLGRWSLTQTDVDADLTPRYLAVSEAEVHAGIAVPEIAVPTIDHSSGTPI